MARRITRTMLLAAALVVPLGAGDALGFDAEHLVDNRDGTVSDLQTGLQWEKKLDGDFCTACARQIEDARDPCLRCWNALFVWSDSGRSGPDGTIFTVFLAGLNDCARGGVDSRTGFAGHCDWRLPTIEELESIVDPRAPGCGDDVHACIAPIFGATEPRPYASLTQEPGRGAFDAVWSVDFGNGVSSDATKGFDYSARAVRTIPGTQPVCRLPTHLPLVRAGRLDRDARADN